MLNNNEILHQYFENDVNSPFRYMFICKLDDVSHFEWTNFIFMKYFTFNVNSSNEVYFFQTWNVIQHSFD